MNTSGLSNMLDYINDNRKYLEGYQSVKAGLIDPGTHAHLFKEKECDSFEKAEEMEIFRSENYSDRSAIKGMPKHVFTGDFGHEMQEKIKGCMTDYYSKAKTKDDVKKFFQECCTAMRVYCTGNLQTSGYNEADNQQIIGQIFEVFSKENERAALAANQEEGIEMNRKYGGYHGDATKGYAYYNSFYYYECEEMRDLFRGMADEAAQKWEIPEINTAEIEKNTGYILDGGLDFNSGWTWKYRNNLRVASIIKQNVAPPENFLMFFNATAGVSQWAGILKVECDGVSIEREVPFEYKGEDIFNVSELADITLADKEKQESLHRFLRNLEIFTVTYTIGGLNCITGDHQEKVI